MSKGILEFDRQDPDSERSFQRAVNAENAYLALWEISQEIFRPARKHGYDNAELQELLNSDGKVEASISILEDRFYEILRERKIDFE